MLLQLHAGSQMLPSRYSHGPAPRVAAAARDGMGREAVPHQGKGGGSVVWKVGRGGEVACGRGRDGEKTEEISKR